MFHHVPSPTSHSIINLCTDDALVVRSSKICIRPQKFVTGELNCSPNLEIYIDSGK
jgi:hypothetical protein